MKSDEPIIVTRDCDAVLIPSGEKCKLKAGSQVWITQSLGENYTAMTDRGYMVRIAGRDADALGMETATKLRPATGLSKEDPEEIERVVWDQLKTCFDPEIPVNIVDLGLVYQCRVTSLAEGGCRAEIRFTLTAPGCGMGELLKGDIRGKILRVPGIRDVDIEIVWDPPWNQNMMSSEAKLQLGMV